MNWRIVIPVLNLAVLILAGCSPKEAGTPEVLKSFTVKGVVLDIRDEGRTLIIDHEEMPGYMGAMTMPFRAKDPLEAKRLSPGDEIEFTYQVAELSSWVENLKPTGKKVEIPAKVNPSDQSSNLLGEGDLFPDFELLNEDGMPVNLKDYRGAVVALTFIFTRCPVPEYCPAMMRNFKEVEDLLNQDGGAPENYQLLTVSFDTAYDTPEVMKAYGDRYNATQSSKWTLLTGGNESAIKPLGEAVGLMFGKNKTSIFSHNLRTVVLDGEGRITKIFTDESWKPEALVAEIKNAATACSATETNGSACCQTQ